MTSSDGNVLVPGVNAARRRDIERSFESQASARRLVADVDDSCLRQVQAAGGYGVPITQGPVSRLRVTSPPDGVTWGMLVGGACLAGMGFTMALFLSGVPVSFRKADPSAACRQASGTTADRLTDATPYSTHAWSG